MSVIVIDKENNTYHGVPDFEYITDPDLYKKEREKFYRENGLILPEVKKRQETIKKVINNTFKYVLPGISALLLFGLYRRLH